MHYKCDLLNVNQAGLWLLITRRIHTNTEILSKLTGDTVLVSHVCQLSQFIPVLSLLQHFQFVCMSVLD